MATATASRGPSGALLIITATGLAGIAGYVVTWLVYRNAGPAAYAAFAIFWSAQFVIVGGLSGVQQEITRATRAIEKGSSPIASRARAFGIVASLGIAVLIIVTSPFWQHYVFPDEGWALVWPLALGAGSYVLVATLCGSLYGVAQWRSLALMLVVDSVLRLALVGVGNALGLGIVALAWAVAVPFGLTIVLLWPLMRGGLVGRTQLDVGYRAVSWNVARTVGASLSTAVLVSGLPLLLRLVSGDIDEALLGELIFTITLTRAPLIVTVMSLQSLLIVRFRDFPASAGRSLLVVISAIVASAAILAALGWWLGPFVLELVSGHPTRIDGALIAVIVVSSGVIAALCATGAAVLAAGRHVLYLFGWVLAAVVTVGILVTPLDFLVRVGAACIAAPLAGIAMHAGWLIARSRQGAV